MARWLGWIFTCDSKTLCPAELATVSDDVEFAYIQLATAGWAPTQNLRNGQKTYFCPDHRAETKTR